MNAKCQLPSIATPVASTAVGLCSLGGSFAMLKSAGAPDFLVAAVILLNLGLIALGVLQWVLYFRGYVDFRIEQLRQERQSSVS